MLAHFRLLTGRVLRVMALAAALVLTLLMSSGVTYASGKAYVRVNQVGYIVGETKWAILMATGSESGASFSVVNAANGTRVYSAPIGASQGSWSTYSNFGLTQRNWVLGENAWGSSFIVGAGDTFPHCMQHQVANLSGSLNGTPPIVLGATVDGPSATANFQGLGLQTGMRTCPPSGGDPFKAFSGKGARYVDNVADWPSVEPADDYTALSILVFAQQVFS